MKLLITGSNGQLGNSIRVRINDILPQAECLFTDIEELDICNKEQVNTLIKEFSPDYLINCAAYTSVDKAESDSEAAFRINGEAPGILAAAMEAVSGCIIHISTDYVFSGQAFRPYTESQPTAPQGVYGKSKLKGELAVLANNSQAVIIRTSWLYSEFGHNFVKTMLRIARDRTSVGVGDDQIGSPTSALYLATALQRIVLRMVEDSSAPTGIYHYVNAGRASWAELAEYVFSVSRSLGGPYASVQKISSSEYPTPVRRPAFSVLATNKIQNDYAIYPEPWRLSVEKIVSELIKAEGK